VRSRWFPHVAGVLVLAALYLGAARFGLRMGFVEQVTAVWPPTGISLAALLLFGYRYWPGVALGALLANYLAHEPVPTACAIAVGNTLEALVGAWLLQRVAAFEPSLARLRDVLSLVVLAGVLSTALCATIGVTSLCLGGVHPWTAYAPLWGIWWLGDAVGAVVVAPLLLTWAVWRSPSRWPGRLAEAGSVSAGLVAVSLMVFVELLTAASSNHPLEYTIFPFVIWAALRLGPPGAALVTFLASSIAIAGTLNGFGPFARGSEGESLILLQLFMSVVAVTGLVLAAVSCERAQAEESLRQSHSIVRAVIEGTTDAVFVKDLAGRYLMINSAGARFLGKAVAEVLGQDDAGLFSADTAGPIMEHDGRIIASGETQTYEEKGTAAGVTRTFLSTKGPYRDAHGKVIGLIGISRDISERKRLEQELRQRATELAEADRRKDEFLAMLAHELRNPLAPIRNAVQVMRLHDLHDPQLHWAREVVQRQVQHLARLVDDLLDVSRITRGMIQLQKEVVPLAAIVARAVETS
jgi:PAS domain S-box-containing protein